MAKLLNQSQAKAVADAFAALNNVGLKYCSFNLDNKQKVLLGSNGNVFVYEKLDGEWDTGERYECQADFCEAYGV